MNRSRKPRQGASVRPRGAEPELGDGRSARLRELIREELNFLLRNEVRDPRLTDVTVTHVELSGSCARIWYSADAETDEALERASGLFRNHLAEALSLKRTPELRFRRDPATRAFATTAENES